MNIAECPEIDSKALDKVAEIGIPPVIAVPSLGAAVPLADAPAWISRSGSR